MTTRIDRIYKSIKANEGKDVYDKVISAGGDKNLKVIIDELVKACGPKGIAVVMKQCGRQCISEGTIERAKAIHAISKNPEDFLRLLNLKMIGGGHLHIKNGKLIGIYEKCYCNMAKATKGLSPLYCHCSAGWYERLFSSVFNKPVEVKKIRTILDGADKCEFEISY